MQWAKAQAQDVKGDLALRLDGVPRDNIMVDTEKGLKEVRVTNGTIAAAQTLVWRPHGEVAMGVRC